jgi:hypothetical protein
MPAKQPGVMGRAVVATLVPARRFRYSARIVKCSTSRYYEKTTTAAPGPAEITAIDVTMHAPPRAAGALSRPLLGQDATPGRATDATGAHHGHHDQPAPQESSGHKLGLTAAQ